MRIAGTHYLGQSDGPRALDALNEVQKREFHQRTQQEIDQAIANIESRLSEKDTGHTPSEP